MIALAKRCVHEHIIDLSVQIIDYVMEFQVSIKTTNVMIIHFRELIF